MAITRKELVQIMRNWATLVLITLMPAFLLIVLAYALTADIHNVPFAVFD
ncbi:MAG: ABC transporter permease, partial [Anaerolineales bacterium]